MPDKTLIQSVKILGTVDNIRAVLHKLSTWRSSTDELLLLEELHRKLPVQAKRSFIIDYVNPPTCGTWRVGIWRRDGQSTCLVAAGMIEAYEKQPGITTIEYSDGINDKVKPVGKAFTEYCEALINELQLAPSDAVSELAKPSPNLATKQGHSSEADQKTQCIFEKKGDHWEITYRDNPFILKDSKGLGYIMILLKNPDKPFASMELVQATQKKSPIGTQVSTGELIEEGLSISNSEKRDMVLDNKAIRVFIDRLDDIKEEKKLATQLHEYAQVEELEKEEEKIKKELSRTTHAGRSKQFDGQSGKARNAVLDAITRARSKIKKQNSALGKYLETTINTGQNCVYHPKNASESMEIVFR
jgi:hypothetical protein